MVRDPKLYAILITILLPVHLELLCYVNFLFFGDHLLAEIPFHILASPVLGFLSLPFPVLHPSASSSFIQFHQHY